MCRRTGAIIVIKRARYVEWKSKGVVGEQGLLERGASSRSIAR
jgi:hypothetical protein